MEWVFFLVPAFIATVAVLVAVRVVGRSLRLKRAWAGGLVAEARCLRTYTTTRGHAPTVSTTLHHVYEFTTPHGVTVRFDEIGGPSTVVEGDIVTVHYAPDRPEHATAHPPAAFKNALAITGLVGFTCAIVGFCVTFVIVAATQV
jgi:hypothetical protein